MEDILLEGSNRVYTLRDPQGGTRIRARYNSGQETIVVRDEHTNLELIRTLYLLLNATGGIHGGNN